MTAAETPVRTPLGEVADLLLHAQRYIGGAERAVNEHSRGALLASANDKLAEARILVDVLRGDGQ